MQELQLYIESNRLDLFKDETVSLTQTIQNVKDVAKVFTSFSKTFSVPASKNNNKIFKHYYNFNIVNGYDARKKKVGRIELNTLPFQSGLIKLDGVTLKNNLAHTYKITFFGNTVELPDIIGDDGLGSLAFSNAKYDLTYNASGILAKLQQATGAAAYIITPLITHTDQLYFKQGEDIADSDNLWPGGSAVKGVDFKQLKYALRLYEIIEEIELKYTIANGYANNIVFSRDFFNTGNPVFYNLYMWLHRKSGNVQPPEQVVSFETSVNAWTGSPTQIIIGYSTITIPAVLVTGSNKILVNQITATPDSASASIKYSLVVTLNGSTVFTSLQVTGTQTFIPPLLVANGVYTVSIVHETSLVFTSIVWNIEGEIGATSWSDTATRNSLTAAETFDFQVPNQIPDISIMSFLTGLFNMFSLVAYVNDSGTIVVRPLEAPTVDFSYYLEEDIDGEEGPINYNISEYTDTTQSEVNIALPYKEIIYAYEGTGTYLAKQHNQLFGSAWGALKYIGGTDEDGRGGVNLNASTETYKVIVPFEHMKFERLLNVGSSANTPTTIQWGYSVNENQEPYIGKPLIFYGIRQSGGFNLSFQNSLSSRTITNSYWIPSNALFQASSSGKQNINFNNELNEYQFGSDEFTATLFAVYHSEYIIDVFNQSQRITQLTSFLPLRITYNLKLNDTFTINSKIYRINSITTDLQSGNSKMELLNKV